MKTPIQGPAIAVSESQKAHSVKFSQSSAKCFRMKRNLKKNLSLMKVNKTWILMRQFAITIMRAKILKCLSSWIY